MRQEWSDAELAASVRAYGEMARMDAAGQKYSKKQIYRDLAERFGRSDKAFEYRMQNISAVLDELGMPWIEWLKPAVNVGAGVKPKLVALVQRLPGQQGTPSRPGHLGTELPTVDSSSNKYKHGDKRTWELALEAIAARGGPVARSAIQQWIVDRHAGYNTKNILSDLAMLAVNSPSRTSYPQNAQARRTDEGSEFDRLFKVGNGVRTL